MWYSNKIYLVVGAGNGFVCIYWEWYRCRYSSAVHKKRTWKSSQTPTDTSNASVVRWSLSPFLLWAIPTGAQWRWRSRRRHLLLPIEQWLTFIGLVRYYSFGESFISVAASWLHSATVRATDFYDLFWFIDSIWSIRSIHPNDFSFFASVMCVPTNDTTASKVIAHKWRKHQNTWTIKWVTKIAWRAACGRKRATFTRMHTHWSAHKMKEGEKSGYATSIREQQQKARQIEEKLVYVLDFHLLRRNEKLCRAAAAARIFRLFFLWTFYRPFRYL